MADKLTRKGEYPISVVGTLFEGEAVSVGWPEAEEFNLITTLRNSPLVREQFLDNRPLDAAENRKWLSKGMRRPRESVLSIRLKQKDTFLGTIGWSDWDLGTATAWFGRLAVDWQIVRANRKFLPENYCGVGMDAAHAITHFAFERMGLERMNTYYLAGNALSARVQLCLGFCPVKSVAKNRPDGTFVDAIEMEMDRSVWVSFHGGCGQQVYRPSSGV